MTTIKLHQIFIATIGCVSFFTVLFVYRDNYELSSILNVNFFRKDEIYSSSVNCTQPDCDDEAFQLGMIQGLGLLEIGKQMGELKVPSSFVEPKVVTKILIVATWRTGSTFLAELIQSSANVFYSFEPIHYVRHRQPRPDVSSTDLVKSIFRCEFTSDYLEHANQWRAMYLNRRVYDACQVDQFLCRRPDFVSRVCRFYPIRLVKTVRLTLDEVIAANVTSDQEPNVRWKVVYLVRDPRAIAASRANLDWCAHEGPACSSIPHLCRDIETDLTLIGGLVGRRPDQYYMVQYENLTSDVERETEKLFEFLQLPITPPVRVFIRSHTKRKSDGDAYSTFRLVSKETPVAWRKKLSADNVANISASCSAILKTLHYPLT